MSDVAADESRVLTDEEILERFRASKSQPSGSRTLGFQLLAVRQADREVVTRYAETLSQFPSFLTDRNGPHQPA